MAFSFEGCRRRPGTSLGRFVSRGPPTLREIALGFHARLGGCVASLRRRQLHSGSPCFRQANRDSLLWRPGPVLSFTNVMHLFSNEFAGLRAGRFSFSFILAGAFYGFLLRHMLSPFATPLFALSVYAVARERWLVAHSFQDVLPKFPLPSTVNPGVGRFDGRVAVSAGRRPCRMP
jgi:hypothetical protein